jgi:hypothetical protein
MTFISLVPSVFTNVKQYGAKGDGSTDDTAAIAAALASLSSTGGVLFLPPGTYITGNQTILSNVLIMGAGRGATTIKLKSGVNADLFSAYTSSINLSASMNSGSSTDVSRFGFMYLTLDGNKSGQTAGPSYPLRFYGRDFILEYVDIQNGYSGGMLCDWNYTAQISGVSDQMEARINHVKIHDNNGIGLQMGGPHDSHLTSVFSYNNTSHGFHFAPNATGMLVEKCHPYHLSQSVSAVGYLVESTGNSFTNCIAEGSDTAQMVILANNNSVIGGEIYGNPGYAGYGVQLGQQSGDTVIPGQILQSGGTAIANIASGCIINTVINSCSYALNCRNENNNIINANVYQTSNSALYSNTINKGSDSFTLNVSGLTTDNTLGKSGGVNISTNGSTYALTITDYVNGNVFQVDNHGNLFMTGGINTAAGFYFTASTTANSLASNGTINAQGLSDIVVAPTANVTGIIMQPGYGGQFCVVVNASSFSITMATSATSHVANGTSCVIAANNAQTFFYNSTTSLWYPC